ncbi:TPA: HD domain-containing protein [Streptococcus suis]|uniref:HD domain-containing protein n=1 Tax=Streptococcus suivaginalis TaxID=3028082 RepID=A0AA96VKQ6_9STRE|nr:HD domain-containing protein [Streptococcus sp. 29896]MCK4028202.1 HD domain-containing protein [Streptococcus suis]WNY46679.1 HD domain-containing protein [Streptococcus sp. 29896]HEL1585948.1 HD domain-containing protein [Streptococcus suis]
MTVYKNDKEFMHYVGGLLDSPKVQKLGKITHHYHSTRLEHSINVSYTSYKIAKKFGWDARATARGGLLHDLFFYDWRDTKFTRSHAWTHPRIAVRNARKLTKLSKVEEDIIVKHMFGATLAPPRYKEAWIVTCVDKYWAVREATLPLQHRWKNRKILRFT